MYFIGGLVVLLHLRQHGRRLPAVSNQAHNRRLVVTIAPSLHSTDVVLAWINDLCREKEPINDILMEADGSRMVSEETAIVQYVNLSVRNMRLTERISLL